MALSRNHKIIVAIGTIIIVSPLAWDLVRRFSRTGIYRSECRGRILKTRRTLIGVVDVFDCSGSRRERHSRQRRDRRNDLGGHYVARIMDDGKVFNVSISGRDYQRVQPGQYLVCRRFDRDIYPSKEEAQKSEAAARVKRGR